MITYPSSSDIKKAIVEQYIEMTGDTHSVASRLVRYRACVGGYVRIFPSEIGMKWLKEQTSSDNELPATVGHSGFTPNTPFLNWCEQVKKLTNHPADKPFYAICRKQHSETQPAFHIEFNIESHMSHV